MLKFDDKSSSIGNIVLLPAGTLAAARIEVRELKLGKQNNTRYADCVFRLEGGEHDRRVIFTNVNDPTEQKYLPAGVVEHSEKGRQMGLNALARMFEACGMARAGDRASYDRLPTSFEESMRALNGKLVAIKIGVEKASGTFPEKNVVSQFLSPNPDSDGYKGWLALKAGKSTEQNDPAAGWAAQPAGQQRPNLPPRDLSQGASWVTSPSQPASSQPASLQPAAPSDAQQGQQPQQKTPDRIPF